VTGQHPIRERLAKEAVSGSDDLFLPAAKPVRHQDTERLEHNQMLGAREFLGAARFDILPDIREKNRFLPENRPSVCR
jgi:hypothetical protein